MSDTKFYFAEYEITGSPGFSGVDPSRSVDEVIRNNLIDYLKHESEVVETDGGDWYFGRVQEQNNVVYGKFGKVYSDEPMTYDSQVGDFVEVETPNIEADYSMFILDLENEIIIFNSTYRVRHRNFIKYFEKGFQNISEGSLSIEINLLHNNEELDYVLQEYPIFQIEAELEPSNPGPDDEWEDLDESMRNMLVNKLGIDAERFEEEGLNVSDDFLSQVTSMAQTQYGESWKITYGDDGELKVVSSEDEPVTKTVDEEPDTLGGLRNLAEDLLSFGSTFRD